jgi:hypothetical protein
MHVSEIVNDFSPSTLQVVPIRLAYPLLYPYRPSHIYVNQKWVGKMKFHKKYKPTLIVKLTTFHIRNFCLSK